MIDLSSALGTYVVGSTVAVLVSLLVRGVGGGAASVVCAFAASCLGLAPFHPALTAGWSLFLACCAAMLTIAAIGLLTHDRRNVDEDADPPASGS